MHTQFCMHERVHETILCAQRSVHANIKFVEPCIFKIFVHVKQKYLTCIPLEHKPFLQLSQLDEFAIDE